MGVGAGLGDPVALGRRADRGAWSCRSPTSASARTSPRRPTATSSCWSSAARSSASSPDCCSRWPAQRDRAERAAAAAEERQRLARVVHDGVLQVLALVQRRGPELGPDGAELGRLAGEQEVRLRGLVQQDSRDLVAAAGRPGPGAAARRACRAPQVHVAVPGQPGDAPGRTGQRGGRRGRVVPEQRAPPRRPRRRGVGAAGGARRPAGWSRCATTVPASPRAGWRSRRPRAGSGVQQSIVGRLRDLGGTRDACTRRRGRAPSGSSRVPRVAAGA